MKITKILLTTIVLTSIATSAFASRAVNIISGDGKNIATAFRDRDVYRWDTSTGALVKSGTDLEYIVSLNEDLKEIRSAKFKENVGPFGEKSNLDINSDILVYTKSNVDNSNSGISYLNAHDLYFRTDNRNHPNLSASSTFRADLISMFQDSKSIRIAPGMDGIKAEDISKNYSEFDHLTSIPTMSHLDKRGETKIDGSVIELHNKAVNGEDEQLTAIDGKHISFNKSGDYKTSVDVDGISTLHYDQGMSAYAGGIDVWGHKNDDTTELREMSFSVSKVDVGGQQIHGVSNGEADTDAVNVAQLKKVKDEITAATGTTTVTAGDHITVTPTINGNSRDYKVSLSKDITDQINNNTGNIAKNTEDIKNLKGNVTDIQNNITNINNNMNSFKGDLSKMDKRIDKSVAGAAALAALHPLDFDPDAKWDFAAGYGHYRSGDAAAIGAFYRPNEDVQLSIGSTVGGDETVFNAGLSVKVGAHNGVSRSRVAIGKEVLALKKTVAEQNAQIQKLTALLNGVAGTKMKADHTTLFPDVAANHWAYEAVSDLSHRGLVEGYPDGTFGGDRLLTRYEFAQIVYRAIQDGVTVDDRLVTEFSPEMALFRVDTVAKNAQGEPTIERVRVNKK
ncbi:MAG: S-layer homology domain-containing protein [Veillonella sp.]|uniref:S-layer homology domain-containing protein n=1 Tax=Veillonella sp. TaxID=1926307 RepID=UPI00290511AD|nr:S-layer homology domain-containing protein [Veillonella sp.]MDU1130449.1 S-layer homology domain-containing protein [Veillonella sp.]